MEAFMYREIITVDVLELREGMVLAENIYDLEGNILLASGIKLRESYIRKIEETPTQRIAIEQWVDKPNGFEPKAKENLTLKQKRQMRIDVTRQEAFVLMKASSATILESGTINATIMQDVIERILADVLSSDDIVFHIDQLRSVDDYLFDHAINVAILSIMTGIVSGFNKQALRTIAMGAILHDVGKLFVNQDVLNKPGPLTQDEFSMIKHHCRLGFDVLKKTPDVLEASALVTLNHHERVDGKGYPNGLSDKEIDLNSKIVGVADVFDALTSDRVYSKKISPYLAMQHIVQQAGTQFDAELVNRFMNAMGYYYMGAVVRLHNDDVAIVKTKDRFRPIVRIVQDCNNTIVHENFEIDLKKNPTVRIKAILFEWDYKNLAYFVQKREGIS